MPPAKNTLLHFLTGTAEPEARKGFERVLSADDNLSKLPDLLKKYHDMKEGDEEHRGQQEPNVLDLDPQAFDSLLKVNRDSQNEIRITIDVGPGKLKNPMNASQIEALIAQFYDKHKAKFDSPKNLEYYDKNKTILYAGPKNLLEEFLKLLGVPGESCNKYIDDANDGEIEQPKVGSGMLKMAFPIEDLGITPDEVPTQIKLLDNWLKEHGLTENTAKFSKDKKKVLFTGPSTDLDLMLSRVFDQTYNSVKRLMKDSRYRVK